MHNSNRDYSKSKFCNHRLSQVELHLDTHTHMEAVRSMFILTHTYTWRLHQVCVYLETNIEDYVKLILTQTQRLLYKVCVYLDTHTHGDCHVSVFTHKRRLYQVVLILTHGCQTPRSPAPSVWVAVEVGTRPALPGYWVRATAVWTLQGRDEGGQRRGCRLGLGGSGVVGQWRHAGPHHWGPGHANSIAYCCACTHITQTLFIHGSKQYLK